MHDAAITTFSGISLVLLLLPLPLQLRAGNSSTTINIAWVILGNLMVFVNCLTWWDSVANVAPVWCDISTKVLGIGLSPGLAAASLCINRRLASIASVRTTAISQRQKRVSLGIDVALGIGLPCVIMALSYIVQPHRFDIYEGYGCQAAVWFSVPAIFIVFLPPVIMNLVSIGYGLIAIRFFLSRRMQFHSLLKSSQSGLDTSHYLRLMALASSDLVLSLPLSTYYLVNCILHHFPYTSWADVHYSFSTVLQVPSSLWLQDRRSTIDLPLHSWLPVVAALAIFLFFGISEDAVAEYIRWPRAIHSKLPQCVQRRPSSAQRALFVPNLGSTIVKPQYGSSDWKTSNSVANEDYDGTDQLPTLDLESGGLRAVDGVTGSKGIFGGVSVSVQRSVV